MSLFTKNYIESEEDLDILYDRSSFTIEGISIEDKRIISILDYLKDEDILLKDGSTINIIKGKMMNKKYDLRGFNKYPEDLNIISIDNDNFTNLPKLAIVRFSFGGRWFDDIIDNMTREICYE